MKYRPFQYNTFYPVFVSCEEKDEIPETTVLVIAAYVNVVETDNGNESVAIESRKHCYYLLHWMEHL